MRTIILQIIILKTILFNSNQEEIKLRTKMNKWGIHATSNPDEKCDKYFSYVNGQWMSSSCRDSGSNSCILATEKYKITNIRELTLKMTVVTEKPRKDLILGYIATDTLSIEIKKIHESQISSDENNVETKFEHTINVTNYKDIILHFSNFYGYCGKMKDLTLSYRTCDQLEDGLVKLPLHGTPNIKDKEIQVNSSCKSNATPDKHDLYYTCLPNGSVVLHGNCMCLPGFRVHNSKCVKCPRYTYKTKAGNEECKTCGVHSYSSAVRNECLCRYGHHREISQLNNFSAPCYSSKPLKLIISSITSDSAYIEWKVINKSINWEHIHYTIHCDNCLDNEGNFPFQTYKRFMQLNDLEASKKYVISVTSSSEEGLTQTASTTIWGKFITTHASYGKDIITITIISIIVPLVSITTTIFVYMYCRQKRKAEHLRKKISSLRRQRRPPKPPTSPTDDNCNNLSDTISDINPYAIFVPPNGFKMCDAPTTKREHVELEGKVKGQSVEDYESMGGIATTEYVEDSSSENPYIMPSCLAWLPISNNHSYVDINNSESTVQLPTLFNLRYINMETEAEENFEEEKHMPLVPMRRRPRLNSRVRATSCLYKGPLGYALDINELNQAKLNSKYTRFDSKQQLNLIALIKRSHSADDINKLPMIL